jgi:hypothetical protein
LLVPVEQLALALGQVFSRGHDPGPIAIWMIRIALAIEPTLAVAGFEQHAVTTGIRRTIANTMLHRVYVDARTQRLD